MNEYILKKLIASKTIMRTYFMIVSTPFWVKFFGRVQILDSLTNIYCKPSAGPRIFITFLKIIRQFPNTGLPFPCLCQILRLIGIFEIVSMFHEKRTYFLRIV